MKCPRDRSELVPSKKGNMDIHCCEECGGFLVTLNQASATQLERLLQKKFLSSESHSDKERLVSPISNELMKPFQFRGVLLDYCVKSHSIWFDPDEYPKMFKLEDNRLNLIATKRDSDDFSTWDAVDGGLNLLDSSGDFIGAVGSFIGDLLSGIDF